MPESTAQPELKIPFPLVGEILAVDLVNTDIVVRRRPIDLLAAPGAYAAWWRAVSAEYPELVRQLPAEAAAQLEFLPAVMTLRGALRDIFCAIADRTALPSGAREAMNRALEHVHDAVALGPGGETRPLMIPVGADGPFAAIARSAFLLLTCADHSRLRRCANEPCVLLFYDTTKSATRRWCSAHCRNQARSRERYRQLKAASGVVKHHAPSETDLSSRA
jgi:predicted RNA-binding Zn ribbon-like protein